MSSLKNKLSLKTFRLVYPFEYDCKVIMTISAIITQ